MIKSGSFIVLAVLCFSGFTRADASDLQKRVEQQDGWVGYRVPQVAGSGSSCCYSSFDNGEFRKTGCDLDSKKGSFVSVREEAAGPDELSIYWHVDNGKADRILAYSANCPVTSATSLRWIDPVEPVDSIKTLLKWVEAHPGVEEKKSTVLPAIALHADEEATRVLIDLASAPRAKKIREESVFWLGHARGARGADFVERVANSDPAEEMREHAVFSLSQSSEKDAYDRVLRISKQDASAEVRGKALFWMAQMEDPRAQTDILAALDSEASDDVREEAVFALSQLDEEDATRALIAVIRGNYPRPVKEKALFWLGESGTDEAMAFLDDMLTR
ncbi:HEAT repeat domain-containing protein [Dokdonella sp.]|uniref:HEAT repeat domain-containing protein n=1 Tax=Dokdonella sp. TaxID=2291710 RepID=UPI0035270B31